MHVALHHIGKRYQKEWIFRAIDGQWNEDSCTAIIGGNGSGKSTLTQIISGFLSSSEGELRWSINDKPIPRDKVYEHVSLCTPVVQLWDDFTLRENIEFFLRFKSLRNHFSAADFYLIAQPGLYSGAPVAATYRSGKPMVWGADQGHMAIGHR